MIVAPLVVSLAVAGGVKPDPEELVRRLGAPAYADREAAGVRLRALGPAAEPALRAGLRSPSPEVARRSAALLGQVEADAQWRRIAGTVDRPTPAWVAFKGAVGGDLPARLLYQRLTAGGRYGRLAEAVGNPDAAAIGYAAELARVRVAYEKQFPPNACGWGLDRNRRERSLAVAPPEDVALVLFLGALARPDAAADPKRVGSIQYEGFHELAGGAEGPAVRKLFAAWLDRRRDPEARADGLYLALHTAIREALPAARRVLADPKAEARPVGYALLVLGNHGEPDDLPRLAAFRNDTRVHHLWHGGGQTYTIQLRDVAAGMLLLAAGEDPKTYGFDWVRRGPADPADGPSYREAGWFHNDADRTAAHQKAWAWLDGRPKGKKPGAVP